MAESIIQSTVKKPIEVTDFFSSTPKLTSYDVYRIDNLFYITLDVANGGTGWINVAQINTDKYEPVKYQGSIMNGVAAAAIMINLDGSVIRYSGSSDLGYGTSFTMICYDK